MRQIECPVCGAPMWQGGLCPWDKGAGCSGRSLVAPVAARKRVEQPPPKQGSRPRPNAVRPSKPRARKDPEEVLRRKREYQAAYRAIHRPKRPQAKCVYDGVYFDARYPSRAKYCSDRCRGRFEREAA